MKTKTPLNNVLPVVGIIMTYLLHSLDQGYLWISLSSTQTLKGMPMLLRRREKFAQPSYETVRVLQHINDLLSYVSSKRSIMYS